VWEIHAGDVDDCSEEFADETVNELSMTVRVINRSRGLV
jgi:hypothetical protein